MHCLGKRGNLSLHNIFVFMVTAVQVVLPNINKMGLIAE